VVCVPTWPTMADPVARDISRANVVGLGLVGGSVAAGLRARGWQVSGTDVDPGRESEAARRGVVDELGLDPSAALTVVATPVGDVAAAVKEALAATTGWVTDVGSVKAGIVAEVADPRFVPGHPMAGSEQHGLDGADGDMFEGAIWVLTPTSVTSDAAFSTVARVVSVLGAEVVVLPPERHDALVAVVSHVPHLTAATMMALADERADEHAALLRLAAGGFRDMTRVASGHPAIWPDICAENRDAIVDALDALVHGLGETRAMVAAGDREGLLTRLDQARVARQNLPSRVAAGVDLAEVRVPVPDRPGAAAEVFGLAAELGVNVSDFEVVHSAEGDKGVLILIIEASKSDYFRGGLRARGFRPGVRQLD
jgi:prephenate dehydrogenase